MSTCMCNQCGKEKKGVPTGLCTHCGRFGNILNIEEGDYLIAERKMYGVTRHKVIKIRENPASDSFYNGWYIDEENLLIDPKTVIYNETKQIGFKKQHK